MTTEMWNPIRRRREKRVGREWRLEVIRRLNDMSVCCTNSSEHAIVTSALSYAEIGRDRFNLSPDYVTRTWRRIEESRDFYAKFATTQEATNADE